MLCYSNATLMQPLLNIGMRAARRAGDLIVRSLSRLDSLKIDSKGRNDFVTDIDRKAEADIIATIRRSHPQHAFLAEESGRTGDNEFVWIIDPLDGTTNFLHGFPTFAVSIALEHKGRLQHAVVYDPMRQEFFTASRGDGAFPSVGILYQVPVAGGQEQPRELVHWDGRYWWNSPILPVDYQV